MANHEVSIYAPSTILFSLTYTGVDPVPDYSESVLPPGITFSAGAGTAGVSQSVAISAPGKITVGCEVGQAAVQAAVGDARYIYKCLITGDQDGLDALLLPITSFQATLRAESQSYLQVVSPAVGYADEIAARASGDIRVLMCRVKNGAVVLSEQIARVPLEYTAVNVGAVNQSVTLSGNSDAADTVPQARAVANSTYKRVAAGVVTARFPVPDIYLRPGDTATVGDDVFTVDSITLYVSSGLQSMEVSGG